MQDKNEKQKQNCHKYSTGALISLLCLSIIFFLIGAGIFWGSYIPLKNKLTRMETAGLQHGKFVGIYCAGDGYPCDPILHVYGCTYENTCTYHTIKLYTTWNFTWMDKIYNINSPLLPEYIACMENVIVDCSLKEQVKDKIPDTMDFYFDPDSFSANPSGIMTGNDVYSTDLNDLRASAAFTSTRFVFSAMFGGISALFLLFAIVGFIMEFIKNNFVTPILSSSTTISSIPPSSTSISSARHLQH